MPGFACLKTSTSSDATYMNHGLSMLSAVLKREGHTCFLNDLRAFQDWEEFENTVKNQNFDVTLIGFHSVDKDFALQACQIIKKSFPDKPIIAGGPHVSIAQEKNLPNIDCIVWGEGEITIVELINNLNTLPNLITGQPVSNLNELPFIDRQLFASEFEKKSPLLPLLPTPFYTINAGRGCPNSCRFCHQSGPNPIFTKKWRVRSVDNFLEEIKTILEKEAIGSIMVHDDVFPHRQWCEELIRKIRQRIPFWCQMRADFICHNRDLMADLADIGLTWVSLGVESGSQRMLDFLKKGVTVEQNRKAIEILHKNNINIFANFFFGGPTETKEDIELSGQFIKESQFSWHSFSTYTCYRGSDLFKYCTDNNLFLDEHYSMTRYPYERKIKDIDYTYLFSKMAEFGQYRGELRQYVPKTNTRENPTKIEASTLSVQQEHINNIEFNIAPSKEPIVSIILTSHNRPSFLTEAINSVFKQTITDWELIIIDDFSTEPNVKNILSEAKKDSRVRAFRTNYDVDNIAVLWNLAMDKTRGKYIAFLDDDNLKRPTFCEELSKYLDGHTEFEAVSCFNEYILDGKLSGKIFDSPKYANKYNILKNNQIDSGCIMIRRTLVDKIGWFDERLKTAEDWDYVKRIMFHTAGFGIIEKSLAIYRFHKENRQYRSMELGFQDHRKFIELVKNYSDKLKLLFFHPDANKITLSQSNVLRGVEDALKNISWVELTSVAVSNFKAINSKYDIIFCFAPFVIDIGYIKTLKDLTNELINFHIEDPQAFKTNLERAKYATHIFTNDLSVQVEYEKIVGKGNVGYCCSTSLNDISFKLRDNVKKKHDVIFVGYPYDSRIEFIKQLLPEIKKKDYNFTLVGGDWSKRGINLPCIDEVNEQELLQIMEESKIVVLYNRRNTDLGEKPESIKPVSVVRGYLECGSGSLIMLDDERTHHNFNGEVVFYKGIGNLTKKIDYYIKHAGERMQIGEKAKQRALRDFTYKMRITKLLNSVMSKRYYFEVV